jgi:hypothetical protein
MRDGGIDFGAASTSAKKKEEPAKKGKKDEKKVEAPVKEEAKSKTKGAKEIQPAKETKVEPEAPALVSSRQVPTTTMTDGAVKDHLIKNRCQETP